MSIVNVQDLVKKYPSFELKDVSFSLDSGRITGFIGRNGAGKTTTIKSMLGMIHPDSGTVDYFDKPFPGNEAEIKRRIGYSTGTVSWYPRKKIKDIVAIVKRFYDTWDDGAYRSYLELFELDEMKTPLELSEGMKVKLNLALSLAHRSDVLILDEPTSGLDPVSREELLETFRFLRDRGVSILFSTHITSDLEKCADDITYIAKGKVIASEALSAFMERCHSEGFGDTLDDIMIHFEKESIYEKSFS